MCFVCSQLSKLLLLETQLLRSGEAEYPFQTENSILAGFLFLKAALMKGGLSYTPAWG